jgi:hypothetical protein
MSDLQQIADELMTAPISKIEAMYNEAWRRWYNEINPDQHQRIMDMLDDVAAKRLYMRTGRGGSFEFKSVFPKDRQCWRSFTAR